MEEQIEPEAETVWSALNGNAKLSVPRPKKTLCCHGYLVDWAIGWLARENKISITSGKRSLYVQLKDASS